MELEEIAHKIDNGELSSRSVFSLMQQNMEKNKKQDFENMITDKILNLFTIHTMISLNDMKNLYRVTGPDWSILSRCCDKINHGHSLSSIMNNLLNGWKKI